MAAPIVTVTPSDRAPIITMTQTPLTTVVAPIGTTTVTTTVVQPVLGSEPLAGAPIISPGKPVLDKLASNYNLIPLFFSIII